MLTTSFAEIMLNMVTLCSSCLLTISSSIFLLIKVRHYCTWRIRRSAVRFLHAVPFGHATVAAGNHSQARPGQARPGSSPIHLQLRALILPPHPCLCISHITVSTSLYCPQYHETHTVTTHRTTGARPDWPALTRKKQRRYTTPFIPPQPAYRAGTWLAGGGVYQAMPLVSTSAEWRVMRSSDS